MTNDQIVSGMIASIWAFLVAALLWRSYRHSTAYRQYRREVWLFGAAACGIVLGNATRADTRDADATNVRSYAFAPHVRFRPEGGNDLTVEVDIPLPAPLPPGAAVEVRYDPADPMRVRLAAPAALEPLGARERLHVAGAEATAGILLLTAGVLFIVAALLPG